MKTKRIRTVFLYILILVLWPVLCRAEGADDDNLIYSDQAAQRLFSSNEGLLSTSSTSIVQTSQGLIFIGGYGGLVCYDGRECKEIFPDQLSNIRDLAADEKGGIWIASSDKGLLYLNTLDYSLSFFSEDEETLEVQCLSLLPDGGVCFGTVNGIGICREDGTLVMEDFNSLRNVSVRHIISMAEDEQYVVTRTGRLYHRKGTACEQIKPDGYEDSIRTIAYEEHDDSFLIGTSVDMILRCSRDFSSTTPVSTDSLYCINDICVIDNDSFLIAADNGAGIYSDERVRKQNLLISNSIDKALYDRQGNIWFVSSRQGVLELSDTHFSDISVSAGLSDIVVNAVLETDDRLYIGQDNGLSILDLKTYKQIEDPSFAYLSGLRIRDMKCDAEGTYWFATKEKGLVCFRDGQWENYDSQNQNDILNDSFRCVVLSDAGVIAGSDMGAYLIQGNEVIPVAREEDVTSSRILCAATIGDSIFIGTDGKGLFECADGKVVRHYSKEDGSLPSNIVMKIKKGIDGTFLWVVTGSVLTRIDGEGNVTKLEDFPSRNNLDLVLCENGNVLIPSGAGIFEIPESDLLFENYKKLKLYKNADGLPYEVTANSNQCVRDDKVFLCGSGGVMCYDEREEDFSSEIIPLYLESVSLDNKQEYPDKSTFVIPKDARRVEFYPKFITYRLEDPILFCYLEGFDEDVERAFFREGLSISYTNLDGGDYKLHFGVEDPDTQTVLQELVIPVRKEYSWYEKNSVRVIMTIVSFVLVTLLSVLITLGINRVKTRRLKKSYEEAEKRHLRELAYQDYLTGLYNRNYMEVWTERYPMGILFPVTFITVDCNDLKLINDRYGHLTGDRLIKGLAESLRDAFPGENSTIIRMGGDEFLLICCDTDEAEARERMDVLRIELKNKKINNVSISFSYGCCTFDHDQYDFDKGIRLSDLNMLKEKARYHASGDRDRRRRVTEKPLLEET